MSKYIVIQLINGNEYYVNQSKCVIGTLDGYTGKKTTIEPNNNWLIKGVWYNKFLGKKAYIDLFDFLNESIMTRMTFETKKGWKYGLHQIKNGKDECISPLSDYGITFIKLEES